MPAPSRVLATIAGVESSAIMVNQTRLRIGAYVEVLHESVSDRAPRENLCAKGGNRRNAEQHVRHEQLVGVCDVRERQVPLGGGHAELGGGREHDAAHD